MWWWWWCVVTAVASPLLTPAGHVSGGYLGHPAAHLAHLLLELQTKDHTNIRNSDHEEEEVTMLNRH